MRPALALLMPLCLAIHTQGLCAPVPEGEVVGRSVEVRCGSQCLAASLDSAALTLRAPGGDITLQPNLQLDQGWTQPEPASEALQWDRRAERVQVTITYPVARSRRFTVLLSAYAGVEAVFATSRLQVLDEARGQYYYWQSSLSGDHYLCPGPEGVSRVDYKVDEWDSMPWRDWWFVPRGEGGTAILPTTVAGRAPGQGGGIFLHAVPRSSLIDPTTSLDAGFGLAFVDDASAAEALSRTARQTKVAALDPGSLPAEPLDYGRPAPEWLREAEVYNLYYRDRAQWTDQNVEDKLKGFPLIVGSTLDKVALDRCHARGIRLLHYVVYTCLLDTEHQVKEGGKVYTEWSESLGNETRDLKDHPDWVCIDKEGKIQHDGWGQEHGHPGLLNTCLHQRGLKEAAVRQVRMLMELGYDGVFIDLSGPTVECYGDELGKHTHPRPEWTNTQAYEDVLRAIYGAVKSFGDDRIVMQNTCTGILPSHWAYCDSQMLEAFPYGAESAALRQPWSELQWHMTRQAEAVAHGKVPVVLPYFGAGTADQMRNAALLSRAYTAMAGFLWADALGLRDVAAAQPLSQEIYAARLGAPTGTVQRARGATYRAFERGIAVVNPLPWPVTVSVPWPGEAPLRDLCYARDLTPREGEIELQVEAESGRLLVGVQ